MGRDMHAGRDSAGPAGRRTTARRLTALAAVCVLALAGCGGGIRLAASTASTASADLARAASAPGAAEAPCGAAAAQTATRTVQIAAEKIYALELVSSEVRADQSQVQGYAPLLSALAAGDRAAVTRAVTSLVYSHTHIVRLRVTSAGAVLADVGGPYIIAPVGGTLRLHGRNLGHYVLSVQDDLGYVKLESRYIGFPLLLHRGTHRIPVEGVIASGHQTIPDSGAVDYRGGHYQAASFTAQAFPTGPLTVTVLVPKPPSSLGCRAIKVYEISHIAQTMWSRFTLVSAPPSAFVRAAGELTGALSFVRSGTHQIAGSATPGPRSLPSSGTVRYRGVDYRVISFPARSAAGPVRVYELVAP